MFKAFAVRGLVVSGSVRKYFRKRSVRFRHPLLEKPRSVFNFVGSQGENTGHANKPHGSRLPAHEMIITVKVLESVQLVVIEPDSRPADQD